MLLIVRGDPFEIANESAEATAGIEPAMKVLQTFNPPQDLTNLRTFGTVWHRRVPPLHALLAAVWLHEARALTRAPRCVRASCSGGWRARCAARARRAPRIFHGARSVDWLLERKGRVSAVRLHSVRVQNFKSAEDSTEFTVSDVTCLAINAAFRSSS